MSRLAAVFITFDQSDRGDPELGYREFNNFKHPSILEAQLQIGSKKFPEMKMTSTTEVFAKLRDACRDLKPLAVHGSVYGLTASALDHKEYNSRDFIVGVNTSKIEGAGFTGFDMNSGATMSLEYMVSDIGVSNINTLNLTMLSDNVVSIQEA